MKDINKDNMNNKNLIDLQLNEFKSYNVVDIGYSIYELEKHLYREEPVTIEQFYEDERFLGKSFNNVYQYWRKVLNEIYPTPFYSPYYEIILSAGTGVGKTTLSTIGLLYDMYKLGCLKDPRKYYNLDATTKIVFALFSANLALAGDVNWSKICEALNDSPWFNDRMMDKRGLQKKSGSLNIVYVLDNIGIQMGSQFQHTMGKAIFGALLDEASFQREKSSQAQKTYNELSSRMASRFMNETGGVPGHLWLASSPKDASDFLQSRIDASQNTKGCLIINNVAQWDVKPELLHGGKFKVFVGNRNKDARIIEKNENIPVEDEADIIEVPQRFYDRFKRDLLISIMNYGGIRTLSDMALIRSVRLVNEAMTLNNPFTKSVISLPFSEDEGQLMDFLNLDYFRNIRHPESNRFIHLDAAYSKDRFGIASSYAILQDKNIYKQFGSNSIIDFSQMQKTYITDFAIAIEAVKGQEISLKKVENFIKFLIKALNYPVISISADTFQSKRTLQEFELNGYSTNSISVDRTRDPYLFLKDLVYERNIILPKVELLKDELICLRDDGKKIDHPPNGCFTGDTKIKLVDGRNLTINELLDEQKYKKNWVYTFNEFTNKIEPKLIKKVFQTKLVKQLIEVTLDNNQVIRCTPEHLFMLRDGSYEEIQNLGINTSLMPIYTKIASKGLKGYRLVYQPVENRWRFEHRIFCNCKSMPKGFIVHHCNYNKLDNCPSNLRLMSRSKHSIIHNNTTKNYELVKQKTIIYHQKMKQTEEYRIRNKKISEKVKEHNKKVFDSLPQEEKFKKNSKINANLVRIKEIENYFNVNYNFLSHAEKMSYSQKYCRIKNPDLIKKIASKVSENHKLGKYKNALNAISNRKWVTNGIENRYIPKINDIPDGFWLGRIISETAKEKMKKSNSRANWSEEKRNEYSRRASLDTSNRIWITDGKVDKYIIKDSLIPFGFTRGRSKVGKNHKIIQIRHIDKVCKVYDLEIEDNHNFALAAGVFVHNSKDLGDAVCGSIWNCSNSNQLLNMAKISSNYLRENSNTEEIDYNNPDEVGALDYLELENSKRFFDGVFNGILKH